MFILLIKHNRTMNNPKFSTYHRINGNNKFYVDVANNYFITNYDFIFIKQFKIRSAKNKTAFLLKHNLQDKSFIY